MESLYTLRTLVLPCAFLCSIDMQDAYLHVPISPGYQPFFRLALEDGGSTRHYQFLALSFGLALAPRIFTKILVEVMVVLISRG